MKYMYIYIHSIMITIILICYIYMIYVMYTYINMPTYEMPYHHHIPTDSKPRATRQLLLPEATMSFLSQVPLFNRLSLRGMGWLPVTQERPRNDWRTIILVKILGSLPKCRLILSWFDMCWYVFDMVWHVFLLIIVWVLFNALRLVCLLVDHIIYEF